MSCNHHPGRKGIKSLKHRKNLCWCIFRLKNAFDTVDHTILLRKIHAWLYGYLKNRSQCVHFKDCNSAIKHIAHGVPQGSILGPLLLIIYINDLSRASDLLFSLLFTDDTSVFIEGTNYNKLFDILNKELKRVNICLKANKLTINTKKTHYMMFHCTRITGDHHLITIDGNPITYSNKTIFLGVIIGHKWNWSDHLTYIKNKISKSIGIINKTRNLLDKNTLRNLYFIFIYPYLIYCIEIWGNTNDTHLNPIIKINKKYTGIIICTLPSRNFTIIQKTKHSKL